MITFMIRAMVRDKNSIKAKFLCGANVIEDFSLGEKKTTKSLREAQVLVVYGCDIVQESAVIQDWTSSVTGC